MADNESLDLIIKVLESQGGFCADCSKEITACPHLRINIHRGVLIVCCTCYETVFPLQKRHKEHAA